MRRAFDATDLQGSVDGRISKLAAKQYGVLSRKQASELGATKNMIRRRLGSGRWEEPFRGVYRMASAPSSWRQELLLACFAWGQGTVVSHQSAAALYELARFESETVVAVSVPRGRRRQRSGHDVHWLGGVSAADTSLVGAIPVTTPSRTIVDLASASSAESVEEALDDALRRHLTSIRRMRWQLKTAVGRPGLVTLRALLDARDQSSAIPQSVLETKLLRLLKKATLPEPAPQYPIRDGGRLVAVVDFAFPAIRLAVEADGYRWHSGHSRWEHDLARRNALTSMGWRVLHVTWNELATKPSAVIQTIERAARAAEPKG